MRKRSQRLWLIGIAGVLAAAAVGLGAVGFKDALAFARTPYEVATGHVVKPGQSVRIGGLVQGFNPGRDNVVSFRITDGKYSVPVTYNTDLGLLPDLFKNDQGVVAEGKLDAEGHFTAQRIIAKHDENYMPKEVYEAFRKKAEMEAAAKKGPGT